MSNDELKCNFCGKKKEEVKHLVLGPYGVNICDKCTRLCLGILEGTEASEKADAPEGMDALTPSKIYKELNRFVIGQDKAKMTLAVAVYNHYKRVLASKKCNAQKSNILVIGPSGTGKTLLAQSLAKMLKVPFAIADATTLTEAGYVGEDVENVLVKLYQAADYDVESAQRGIVYIDEIDKISRRSENRSLTRDVGGEGVQQALLKIVEGAVVNIPPNGGRKHPQQQYVQIDTSNILFICGGAFDGLEKAIKERTAKRSLGFTGTVTVDKAEDNVLADVETEDLVKYGLIPELVGRLPVVTLLDHLDEAALIRILQEPEGSLISQYTSLFEADGVELSFTPEALSEIAHIALQRQTGARGLRAIMEQMLTPIMYSVPDDKSITAVTITKDTIYGNGAEYRRDDKMCKTAS